MKRARRLARTRTRCFSDTIKTGDRARSKFGQVCRRHALQVGHDHRGQFATLLEQYDGMKMLNDKQAVLPSGYLLRSVPFGDLLASIDGTYRSKGLAA
jgi:hypothetical protein